jgi:peptidyl-prolyl cis-trans isomerase C
MEVTMKPLFADVIVNGETIAPAAIAAEAQNHEAPRGKPGWAWKAAARSLVVRALLLQAAREQGLSAEPEMIGEARKELPEEALIRRYLDQNLSPRPVSEEDCLSAYRATPDRFRAPDLFEASHILFKAESADTDAGERAHRVLDELARHPERFGRLAKDLSDCSSGANGGALGQLGAGDTVAEFEAALQALNPGEIGAKLVKTEFGFHIVRLDKKAPGALLPFEAVAVQLRQALEKAAWVRAANDLVAGLVADADIQGVDMETSRAERAA